VHVVQSHCFYVICVLVLVCFKANYDTYIHTEPSVIVLQKRAANISKQVTTLLFQS